MRFFVSCQIDVVNKQFFSSLSWNNPLPKTTLGESYILMIGRHLDVKKKHSLDLKFVFYLLCFLIYVAASRPTLGLCRGAAIPQGTLVSILKICYVFLNKKRI